MLDMLKPTIALYMGGMGAKEQNFHSSSSTGWARTITERVWSCSSRGSARRRRR